MGIFYFFKSRHRLGHDVVEAIKVKILDALPPSPVSLCGGSVVICDLVSTGELEHCLNSVAVASQSAGPKSTLEFPGSDGDDIDEALTQNICKSW